MHSVAEEIIMIKIHLINNKSTRVFIGSNTIKEQTRYTISP